MPKVNYKDKEFDYKIIRRKRRTIGIRITDSAEIEVTCPTRLSNDVVNAVVESKAPWILSKLEQVQAERKELVSKTYEDGEQVIYLGNKYTLRILEWSQYSDIKKHVRLKNLSLKLDKNSSSILEQLEVILNELKIYRLDEEEVGIRFINNEFQIYISQFLNKEYKKELVKQVFLNWYKEAALIKLYERTYEFAKKYNLKPAKVSVKAQKTIWGSCSSSNNISYNWKLVLAPIKILDYVVVHELSHLVHRDHSSDFWGMVEHIIPDYRERRAWLKVNGRGLDI